MNVHKLRHKLWPRCF